MNLINFIGEEKMKKAKEKNEMFSVNVPKYLLDDFREITAKKFINRSKLMTSLIEKYIKRENNISEK